MSRRDYAGPVKKVFSRHLDSRGDGTGVTDAVGKYADATVTFTNATNVVNLATHGLVAGDGPFQFTTGALPAELDLLTDYWIVETVAAGTFQVALTQGGTAVEFTDDGSGTNTIELPFRMYIEAAAGEILRITRLLVHIEDLNAWQAEHYGNLAAALTVGITVNVEDADGNIINNLTEVTVKNNADWGRYCYDVSYVAFGAGNDFLQARWTFEKAGSPLRLKVGEKFVLTLNDDFDGLDAHSFVVQGIDEGQWTHKEGYGG